jgi:hypothetical protein
VVIIWAMLERGHMISVSTQIAVGDDVALFERMLRSVSFASEIIIFNMERDDDAYKQLRTRYNAREIRVKTPKIVESIRGEQVRSAEYPWVLIMDFDEIIPEDLATEISSVTSDLSPKYAGYFIKRNNYSLGYPLKHGGWGNDQVARLLYRASFVSWPAEIHSLPRITGHYGHLSYPMEHHKDASLAQMIEKTIATQI